MTRFRAALVVLTAGLCAALFAAENPVPLESEASVESRAQDKIWTAVILAKNAEKPKEAPPELREFAPRLKRVFGYNQFELFGSAANEIGEKGESWPVPSKSFWLGVKARRATSKETRGGYLIALELFQNQRPLVDTEVKLAPGSPLFIRGPQYGDAQIIIVLQIQR